MINFLLPFLSWPPECAVVLDLLMALPEELPLLDGGKLRQHMIEVITQTQIEGVGQNKETTQ